MRKKFSTKIQKIVFGIMLLTMFLAAFGPGGLPVVHAQEGSTGTPAGTPPPQPPTIPGKDPGNQPPEREGVPGATRAENGQWSMSAGNEAAGQDNAGESVYSSKKTDDFGYTWKTPKTYSWIDTSGGTDTGITTSNYSSGPVDIGFPFKYYENTYSQIYISLYGFLSFQSNYLYDNQSYIPDASPPNDVIAPYWSPVDDITGYVHYLQGGVAPNRWFAVEWNQMYSYGNTFTFEAILYENGNIDFQYGNMIYGNTWWCQASGIEDFHRPGGIIHHRFLRARQIQPRGQRPAPGAFRPGGPVPALLWRLRFAGRQRGHSGGGPQHGRPGDRHVYPGRLLSLAGVPVRFGRHNAACGYQRRRQDRYRARGAGRYGQLRRKGARSRQRSGGRASATNPRCRPWRAICRD